MNPMQTGHLAVGHGATLYWEMVGNPAGVPVVHLHAVARFQRAHFLTHVGVLQVDELDPGQAQDRQQLLQRERAPLAAGESHAALP